MPPAIRVANRRSFTRQMISFLKKGNQACTQCSRWCIHMQRYERLWFTGDQGCFQSKQLTSAFWGAAVHWSAHLKSDMTTIRRSFTLLIAFTINSLRSYDTVRPSVLWNKKWLLLAFWGKSHQPTLGQSVYIRFFHCPWTLPAKHHQLDRW